MQNLKKRTKHKTGIAKLYPYRFYNMEYIIYSVPKYSCYYPESNLEAFIMLFLAIGFIVWVHYNR